MNVTFNPNAAAHNPNARPPQTQTTPTTTATPEDSGDGVEITLSQAAKQALKAGASDYTGNSPAHLARQYIAESLTSASTEGAEGPDLSGPFGQIVKTFAPGHNKGTEGTGDGTGVTEPTGGTTVADGTDGTGEVGDGTAMPPTEGGDTTTVADGTDGTDGTGTTDGGDTIVADGTGDTGDTGTTEGGETIVVAVPEEGDGIGGTDPTIVVEEPDITEVLGESAPAEGEVTEPESGLAGSGDAVASSGDVAPVDDGTAVDSVEPVTVADTGDGTDELLDLLDEGSEEIA